MNFDFSAFTKEQSNIEDLANIKKDIEIKEEKATIEEPKIVKMETKELVETREEAKVSTKTLTADEQLDLWIKELEGTPKVVYNSLRLYCTFDDKTEVMTILDKSTKDSYEVPGRDKFENIVFCSKSRPDRENKILKYLEDIHLVKLKKITNIEECNSTVHSDENIEENVENTDVEGTIGDVEFSTPEDIA